MTSLSIVKQSIYRFSPGLYSRAYQLYSASFYARMRRAKIEHDVARKLEKRLRYEAEAIRRYFGDDWAVRHGPFAGMKYPPRVVSGSLLSPKIIGSYESPLHRWIEEAVAAKYQAIVNIGCAEGYYSVGLARRCGEAQIYAYDIDERARANSLSLARLNGVNERIHIGGTCTIEELNLRVVGRALVFCDIEGGELDLLRPDLVPGLTNTDLIVETHDDHRPGLTQTLLGRFRQSHRAELVYHCAKSAREFPVLARVPASEHALLLEEGRPRDQCWIRLVANPADAIEPTEWWSA